MLISHVKHFVRNGAFVKLEFPGSEGKWREQSSDGSTSASTFASGCAHHKLIKDLTITRKHTAFGNLVHAVKGEKWSSVVRFPPWWTGEI